MGEEPTATNGGCPPLEQIAAFVDGKLDRRERDVVAAHLGDCEQCYEVFAGTVRFRREDGAGGVAAHPRTGRAVRRWVAAAAAAGVAAGIAGWWLWLPPLPAVRTAGLELRDLVERRTDPGRLEALPTTDPDWSYLRGGTPAGVGSRRTAFRLGVLVVDLETALRSDEPRRAEAPLRRLAYERTDELFDVFYLYEEVGRLLAAGAGRRELLQTSVLAAGTVAERARDDPEHERLFALGSWAEASRLAALAGDGAYFDRSEIVDFLESLEPADLPVEVREPLREVRKLLVDGAQEEELPELAASLARLVERGGDV